ncbi:MAG: hypothetical protein L6R35_002438 [Caloplaca aegaea]|nr:MAG: hypothetical protein L6R35_002438 [Caloplaca aegaea]
MADNDRGDSRELHESPFATLARQVAGLRVENGDTAPQSEEDNDTRLVEIIDSLCMSCEETGETRMLLTKIPYFREIILTSFSCSQCGASNTDIQSAGQIQERGANYSLKVTEPDHLERQIVKSDTAVFRLEELDIEMPPGHGQLTNIEGILLEILKDLESGQRSRKKEDPDLWEKVDVVVQSLLKRSMGQELPFTITIDDPSGNSWIEPPSQTTNSQYQKSEYPRTAEQNASLGLGQATSTEPPNSLPSNGITPHVIPAISTSAGSAEDDPIPTPLEDVDILSGHNYSLETPCPGCTHPAHLNLQLLNIPHFKEVIVSAVMCTHCNYRSSDVKTGGAIPSHGKRIFLDVRSPRDLGRDILKSETCRVLIPQVGVEVEPGTMGGRFTTVEGLLTQIRDDLRGTVFDVDEDDDDDQQMQYHGGDSMPDAKKQVWVSFFKKLDAAIAGEMHYTIELDDPLANSYVQSLTPDGVNDEQVRAEEFARSESCEEELGINDMRTKMGADGEYEKEEVVKERGGGGSGGNSAEHEDSEGTLGVQASSSSPAAATTTAPTTTPTPTTATTTAEQRARAQAAGRSLAA